MSGNPDSGESDLKLKYLDDYPDLPVDAPLGCPHIVDFSSLDEEFTQEEMSIPDLVVTLLFKYRPAALDAFLDLERKEVHFVSHRPRSSTLDFCIQRYGRIVKIGYLNEREAGGWDILYKYRIDANATGKWTPVSLHLSDEYRITGPERFLEGVPTFAWIISDKEVWEQDEPDVEIEWFAGLLQGRKI